MTPRTHTLAALAALLALLAAAPAAAAARSTLGVYDAPAPAAAAAAVQQTQVANFTLPPLPFDTTAFEPSVDNQTMTIHWTSHVRGAINTLNAALPKCLVEEGKDSLGDLVASAGATGDEACDTAFRRAAGALWNHALLYNHIFAPINTSSWEADASPELKAAVKEQFGDFEAFKANVTATAATLFGSGWVWVAVDPQSGALNVFTLPNQDNPLMALSPIKGRPIFGIDLWEHQYYLKYQNGRPAFVAAFYDVVNWEGVSNLYALATEGEGSSPDVLTPGAGLPETA